ncbi:hypothetical protein ACWD3K_34345 [Streptomyces sp. NPDC002778]
MVVGQGAQRRVKAGQIRTACSRVSRGLRRQGVCEAGTVGTGYAPAPVQVEAQCEQCGGKGCQQHPGAQDRARYRITAGRDRITGRDRIAGQAGSGRL